jgi:hypothetical protein
MHVFINPPEDDQWIETSHGERDGEVNIVILLILLTLYPVEDYHHQVYNAV